MQRPVLVGIAGGLIVVGGGLLLWRLSSSHPGPAKASSTVRKSHVAKQPPHTPKTVKTGSNTPGQQVPLPTNASAPGNAAASFQTVTGLAAPLPLQVVTVPWDSSIQWAVEPVGLHMKGNANVTLWFGEKRGAQNWYWIPSTLPGALSAKLPTPIADSLLYGLDLANGSSGPNLNVGSISWNSIAGHVSRPLGWTLTAITTTQNALGTPAVGLTVWDQSYAGSFTGYYGLNTLWNAQNAKTGVHDLQSFTPSPDSLAVTVVHSPLNGGAP